MGHFAGKVVKRHVNFVKWPDASAEHGDAGNQVESRMANGDGFCLADARQLLAVRC